MKAMILGEVIMGRTIKLYEDDISLIEVRLFIPVSALFSYYGMPLQPPPGYDSVVGEPGDILNYDESIGTLRTILTACPSLISITLSYSVPGNSLYFLL